MTAIGFVGLGLMGSAMTTNLIAGGFEVRGYDTDGQRRREHERRGGTVVDSPAAVADGVDIVMLSLPNGHVVEEVCFGENGLAATAAAGSIIIDATTAHPRQSIAAAARLADGGIYFLDAAVSGTSRMAQSRDLITMVGGDREAYERAGEVLDAVVRARYHLGPVGNGVKAKLVVNLMLGLSRAALAESLLLGERAGMDLDLLLDVLRDSVASSRVMDIYGPRMVAGEHQPPTGRIRSHAKDIQTIADYARDEGASLWLTPALGHLLDVAKTLGLAEWDSTATIEVLRRMSQAAAQYATPSLADRSAGSR